MKLNLICIKNVYEFMLLNDKVQPLGRYEPPQNHVSTLFMHTPSGFHQAGFAVQLFKNSIAGRLLGRETINAPGVGDSHTGTPYSD
jgi:hypothetical protein